MQSNTKQIGLAIGIATVVAVGYLSTSAQYVPGGGGGGTSIATTTCTNGQVVTAINNNGTVTCGDAMPNAYGGTHLEWKEEFMLPLSASNGQAYGDFMCTASGAGAQCNTGNNQVTTTRPGLVISTTGTTNTGRSSFNSSLGVDFGSGNWAFEWTGGVTTLSTAVEGYALIVGFADVNSAVDQVDGCYFVYDERNASAGNINPTNASKWEAMCASNSTRTQVILDGTTQGGIVTVDSAVAALTLPDTNMYTLQIVMTGASSAAFKINGTTRATITTNIPSGVARLTGPQHFIIKSVGTTGRTYTADRMRLAVDLTAARSP